MSADDRADQPDAGEHDEGGLELARAIARALRATAGGPHRGSGARQPGSPTEQARRRGRGSDTRSSGAHPDDRDPQPLDATIDRLVAEHGWSTDVAVHGVFGRWDSIVGPEVARHCHPERFADARLTVRTDSTAWSTQVRMLAPTVVRRLNEELGADTVARIEVLGPHRPSWSKGGRSLRDARGPRDTYG